jgi:hypothetical protein
LFIIGGGYVGCEFENLMKKGRRPLLEAGVVANEREALKVII